MTQSSTYTQPEWLSEGWEHIWAPYTQMQTANFPLPVIDTKNTHITLEDGRTLIDGIASWWSSCHGYKHPHIMAEMHRQIDDFPHVMFAGLAHEPAYKLATRLTKIAPDGLSRVFFSDSGSVSVEVAMKMAVQYWINRKETRRHKFICFRNGYHGDTMGGMSLADKEVSMHRIFQHFTPKQYVLDIPNDEYSFAEFEEIIAGIAHTAAGLVMEPLVQGAGGMKFHSSDTVAEIFRICKKYDILFIADEVATGFGRTGTMFACEEAGITPDIMCLGKALTGGTTTLAATLATDEIFSNFLSDEMTAAFMHGPTFMANPLACAAANASLDLFEKEPRLEQVLSIESQLRDELRPCRTIERVKNIRVKGAIGVVQLNDATWEEMFSLRNKCIESGVWLRPFGDVVYLTPSFTIAPQDLSHLTGTIVDLIKKL